MEKKTIFIINKFIIENDEEKSISIEARNENNDMYWRYSYKLISKANPEEILDSFFMELREFQRNGYNIKFKCKQIQEKGE